MKFTNKKILDSYPSLQRLGAVELPVKVSFEIGRTLQRFHQAQELVQELRSRLLDKHAIKDGQGRRRLVEGGMVPLADPAGFEADIKELLDIESEFEVKTISLESLGDIKLPADVLAPLDWLITA